MRSILTAALLAWMLLSSAEVRAQSWTKLVPATGAVPSPRQNASGVYDPSGNSLIIFGGRNGGGNLNDVWSFNLDSLLWRDITPPDTPQPAPRFAHTAIYDPVNHAMIIWSGQGSEFYNDLWSFDLTTRVWQRRSPAGTLPLPRYGSVAIYDPTAHRVTTFAGFTTSGRFQDTRAYEIALNSWFDLTPSGETPPQRCLHAACYDAGSHRMVIYGGQNVGPLDDIWAFDLAAGTWADLTPSAPPPGRIFPSTVYIEHHVIVFGGLTVNGAVNETWSYNLSDSTWTMITPSGGIPEKRNGHAAISGGGDRSMIIFGGNGDSLYNDVWRLSGIVTGVSGPPPLPLTSELRQNYPNPFNPVTRITYTLAQRGDVRLDVYNILGEKVATLVDEIQEAGYHAADWNAGTSAGGVYVLSLRTPGVAQTRKMVLAR